MNDFSKSNLATRKTLGPYHSMWGLKNRSKNRFEYQRFWPAYKVAIHVQFSYLFAKRIKRLEI